MAIIISAGGLIACVNGPYSPDPLTCTKSRRGTREYQKAIKDYEIKRSNLNDKKERKKEGNMPLHASRMVTSYNQSLPFNAN